jgi:hypothetical protein
MRLEKRDGPEEIELDPLRAPSFLIKPLTNELMLLAEAELRPL